MPNQTISNFVANVSFGRLAGTTLTVNVAVATDVGDTLTTSISGPISTPNATMETAIYNQIKQAFLDRYNDTFAVSPVYKVFGWPLSSSG